MIEKVDNPLKCFYLNNRLMMASLALLHQSDANKR